jgi:acyl-coenzyme A thioesterase PaaI-like protein
MKGRSVIFMRTKKVKDTYGEPEILHVGNNVVKVYHPILTDEERERRMNAFKAGCARFMMALEESHRQEQKKAEQ